MTSPPASRRPGETVRPASLALTTVLLALLGMFGPFSIDSPFPAFAAMGEQFRVSDAAMQLVVSAYLASFAARCLFHVHRVGAGRDTPTPSLQPEVP